MWWRAVIVCLVVVAVTGCGPAVLPHQIESFSGPIRVEVQQQGVTTVLSGHLELSREPFRFRFDDADGAVYRWDDRGLTRLGSDGEVPVTDPRDLGRLSILRQAFEAEPMPGTVRRRETGHLLVEDGGFRMEVRFGDVVRG